MAQTNVNILADLDENQSGKNEVKYSLTITVYMYYSLFVFNTINKNE